MNPKLQKLVSSLDAHRLDAYLITKDVNIAYLTGFPASESWLLVSPRRSFYITDFRYILEAKAGLKGISVIRYTKSASDTFFALSSLLKAKRVGFDDRHVSLSVFKRIKKSCGNRIQLVTVNGLVEGQREIKSKPEIAKIKDALSFHLKAYRYLREHVKPGITERELLLKLETYVKVRNAGFSFDPIIASGPNSAYPHAKISDRKLRTNEPLLIDMGIDIEGYKSDLTRVVFLGKIPPLIKEVCSCVYTAQQKAIAKIKANVLARQVDYEARNYLAKKGLAKYFGHSLGHGVGLEIHESPSVSQTSPATLKEGMIITVEPAVYLPNKFGIRIEDMVLVTKKGCEVLSKSKDTDQICP